MTVPFPFVANAVLTAAQLNAITSLPTTAKTASATLTAAEAVGYRVTMTSATATTITINTAVFATGDTVFITNLGTATCTITAGTATVTSAGSLVLTQYGSGLLVMTATGSGVWYASSGTTGYVTALPASPVDGQEVVLTDSLTAGTYAWQLRYNASATSTYKWDFIGGTAMQNQINTTENKAAGATYGALTTAGPTITVPRAGDYDVLVGALIGTNTGTAKAAMSFDIGATGAVNANAAEAAVNGVSSTIASARTSRLTGVAASTALTAKYLATSVSSDFGMRYMYATPVRVS